ncbi:hypothetical protein B0H19DRAFT_1234419 [Mycena capillaripes]|nr:hypothetical protein B0H19DRAFT_1234419 [Mycena capillaripes]
MTTAAPAPAISVLGNPDLLRNVLQGASVGLNRTDLVNIALTWSAFRGPALDSLWRDLTSFIPLLKLIPGLTVVDGLYTLFGPLSPSDFARFDYHAARVRRMKLNIQENTPIDASVFIRISQEHRGPILPLLQQLQIRSSAHLNASLPLLLTPTLRSIRLTSDEGAREGTAFAVFLSMAAHSFPGVLDHLVLEGTLSPTILDLIPRFNHLRTLDMRHIDQSITYMSFLNLLNSVSSSAYITSLLIQDLPEWLSPESSPTFEAVFPGLKTLDISGGFDFIEKLVMGLGTSNLQRLTLSFNCGPTEFGMMIDDDEWLQERWGLLFAHIAAQWQSSLAQISIKCGNHLIPTGFLQVFGEFRSLVNLREFFLIDAPTLDLEENDVLALTIGCPSLEILGLVTAVHTEPDHAFGGHREMSLPSINVLIHLADHCPSLRELEISLDLDKEIGTKTSSVLAHGLEDLTIFARQSPRQLGWNRSNRIAKFLDVTFPTLKSVHGYGDDGNDWEAMDSLVQLFQAARAHERCRMSSA